MVENGYYNFLNWFDERAWYPLGRIVGGTVYPGLMLTSGLIHWTASLLHIPIHIRDICVFLAPIFSGLTAISTYLLTKELWNEGAGLFAACFIAIVPGYISRSVAGSYDNEGIAIFALMFTYYLWIKSVKTGAVSWSCLTALSYLYMVSAWGGYVFIINLIPLHVLVLMLMGRYSNRLYVSYSAFYVLGTLFSMQIPFVGFQPVRTSEHMAAGGVFVLIQAYAFLRYMTSIITRSEMKAVFFAIIAGIGGLVFAGVVGLTYLGYIAPWSGRFYSLWDTGYAKIHIPIIASVSEHQPTTWFSFFFDLHLLVPMFVVGLWYVIKNVNDERVFIALYAITASYFAGVMVRLMLTLTPVVCILSAIAFSEVFSYCLQDDEDETPKKAVTETADTSDSEEPMPNKKYDRLNPGKVMKPKSKASDKDGSTIGANTRTVISVCMVMLLMLFVVHCTWVTSNAYSSPSIVLASYSNDGSRVILDDFREAYHWLSQNTEDKSRVMSWWDYGYQIAGMANRTTLVDNNTWNNSHIALVGKAMSSNESAAYEIMQSLDVDYVLVIFGGVIGYSGDDINKFLWMVRIAEGEHPHDIRESDYFTDRGEFRVDSGGAPALLNCLMYKLSYYRFGELQVSFLSFLMIKNFLISNLVFKQMDYRSPPGYDRTRNSEIGNKNIKLEHLEEAYTTEHWLVRIYRVKNRENRPRIKYVDRTVKAKSVFTSKKTSKKRKGTLRAQPTASPMTTTPLPTTTTTAKSVASSSPSKTTTATSPPTTKK
jgi:dolichyl-diphosphooligosaccharide--protein glycosyltransferase